MTQAGCTAIGCGCLKALALAGILAIASPAMAEPLPVLKAVTGLQAGDHLNVRAEPTAQSADIGDVDEETVLEVLSITADGAWARIPWQEGNGWVAARYLRDVVRPRHPSGLPLGLMCTGSEPFWSLNLTATGEIIFETPVGGESGEIDWATLSRNTADMQYAFRLANLTGVLRRGACIEAGSGRETGWSLDLVQEADDPVLLSGCCIAR